MTRSYIKYYRWNNFVCKPVSNSVGIIETSLYGHSGLNPTVILSVNLFTKTYTSLCCFVF